MFSWSNAIYQERATDTELPVNHFAQTLRGSSDDRAVR